MCISGDVRTLIVPWTSRYGTNTSEHLLLLSQRRPTILTSAPWRRAASRCFQIHAADVLLGEPPSAFSPPPPAFTRLLLLWEGKNVCWFWEPNWCPSVCPLPPLILVPGRGGRAVMEGGSGGSKRGPTPLLLFVVVHLGRIRITWSGRGAVELRVNTAKKNRMNVFYLFLNVNKFPAFLASQKLST